MPPFGSSTDTIDLKPGGGFTSGLHEYGTPAALRA